MKSPCEKWQQRLREAALGEPAGGELREHLAQCPDCAAELDGLRARRERLDSLLPLIASGVEPSPDLHARIMAAAAATAGPAPRRARFPRAWALAAAAAVIMVLLVTGWRVRKANIAEAELHGAQSLAEWRAPTDVLLRSPGDEFLRTTPKLGGFYINLSSEKEQSKEQ